MFVFLVSLPPVFKLGLVLLSIVLLMRARAPMAVALLVGAAALGVLFPMSPAEFSRAALHGVFQDKTLLLGLIVGGLLTFSGALNSTGQIQRIIDAFTRMTGRSRLTLVTFPAVIGFLPMPGGAIFSAPMVEIAVKDAPITPSRTTAANYWFRHIWEYWFPLYPGIILFLTLTKVNRELYILAQLPMTLCSLLLGYLVLLRGLRLGGEKTRNFTVPNLRAFFHELTPILVVVGCVLFLSVILDAVLGTSGGEEQTSAQGMLGGLQGFVRSYVSADSILLQDLPVLAGLVLAFWWLFRYRGLTWRTLASLTAKKNTVSMLLMVIGVLVFQSVLDNSSAVRDLNQQFERSGIPLAVVVCAVPFVCGLVIGVAFGFVGASFPLVIALLSSLSPHERFPYYCLAYVWGYTGMMLSPVHICLIITNEYFKSRLLRVYAYITPLSLLSAGFGVLLFFFYRMF
jgi:uncharacterized protein